MIEAINIIIGCTVIIIFMVGMFCNILVKKKYLKMFKTMGNADHDKNLLIIERDYRHGYLKDRVERIKIFVEKEYYQIKLGGIPLYVFEDFTISSVYLVVLLGLTFTFILVALPTTTISLDIFILGITGLLCGTILYGTRVIMGVPVLRDMFKINLCDYLEYELELFEEVEKDEEDIKRNNENEEENTINQENQEFYEGAINDSELRTNRLSANREESESIEIVFDESAILQMLEEILG